MVLPDVEIAGGSKLVEYNREWSLNDEGKYECHPMTDGNNVDYSDTKSDYIEKRGGWLRQIVDPSGITHDFFGGTQNFGVYDIGRDAENSPVYILAAMSLPQFK